MENQNIQFDLPERSEVVQAIVVTTELVVRRRGGGGKDAPERRPKSRQDAGAPGTQADDRAVVRHHETEC